MLEINSLSFLFSGSIYNNSIHLDIVEIRQPHLKNKCQTV
jgi:hypothetical protein